MKNILELTSTELAQIKISILNKMIENVGNEKTKNSIEENSKHYRVYNKLNYLNELYNEFTDEEKQYLKDNFDIVFIDNSGTVGERIKEIRNSLKLNQFVFASELGISQTHISGIENGKENPSLTLVKLISLKYEINEKWILNGDITKKKKKAVVTTNNNHL